MAKAAAITAAAIEMEPWTDMAALELMLVGAVAVLITEEIEEREAPERVGTTISVEVAVSEGTMVVMGRASMATGKL